MEESATTHAAASEVEALPMMALDKQAALDRFVAAADAFKHALHTEVAASSCNYEADVYGKKMERVDDAQDEMGRCGRELEESVRVVMAAFGGVSESNGANLADNSSTASVDGESSDTDSANEAASTWRDEDSATGGVHSPEDSTKSVLILTLKRENKCLLEKITALEKDMANAGARRALDVDMWAKRIKAAEVNVSLAVTSQRALEIECGAERRRVEHLRNSIKELNSRLTAAEQATCRARMATVLMEAKYAFNRKMPSVDESEVSLSAESAAVGQQTNQLCEREDAASSEELVEQDARSQSSTSSEGNRPRERSGSLLRSPIGYQRRKCSRSRCLVYSADDGHAAPTEDYTSPRTRRSSLHFSPSKTTTPEDRGSRSIRPRSEPPVDHRTTQRPRWKR